MPKKIRELKALLKQAGFVQRAGRGSHTVWSHPDLPMKISMLIEWSVEDDAYVVSFQEFPGAHTHGSTYVDAVKNGQEALDLLVESYKQEGRPLPEPALRQYALA